MTRATKPDTFAARLRAARMKAGLTQQQLAQAAGLSLGHVASWEAGRTRNPTLAALVALGSALGCSLDQLAGR
jgi:transcriptional regulator with XRE-family HTH domain